MNDECGNVPYRLHLPRGSVREHDAGGCRNLDDADPVLIGVVAHLNVIVMSEASIFGEGATRATGYTPPATDHVPCWSPAHGLFGAKAGACSCSDRAALYGRIQSNSSASFTART